jgi:hypothetical protein
VTSEPFARVPLVNKFTIDDARTGWSLFETPLRVRRPGNLANHKTDARVRLPMH